MPRLGLLAGFPEYAEVPLLVDRRCEGVPQLRDVLAHFNPEGRELIPLDTITRPPSAELRPDQKDSDSLPDYDVLDAIIQGYVEQDKAPAQLIAMGLPEGEVKRAINLVDRNEYKRRQSPPGVRITTKAFGKDRRLPITNRYHLRLDALSKPTKIER